MSTYKIKFSRPTGPARFPPVPGMPLAERFWRRVDKRGPDECWSWLGGLTHGHGMCFMDGRNHPAHRVSLMLAGVELLDGYQVDHTCRNRKCVNPTHLRQVTPRQNALENNDSAWAVNARKTHCIRGHAYDEANTIRDKRGGRQCRACIEMRTRGEIPKKGPRPLGWKRKMQALEIGESFLYPTKKDSAIMTSLAKKIGRRVRVLKLNEDETLVTRVL